MNYLIISTLLLSLVLAWQQPQVYWVDKFENEKALSSWKGRANNFEEIYKIDTSNNNQFLRAVSKSTDNFIIKEIEVDIVEYPYLNWKWRANKLPNDANEHHKKSSDVAASVYLIIRPSKWRPQSIKYTWSSTLEIGSTGSSPFAFWPSRSDFIVLESGKSNLKQWKTEKVNVLEDYKRLYNKEKLSSFKVKAISIMTDSDNTSSEAAADYDDIFFSKD